MRDRALKLVSFTVGAVLSQWGTACISTGWADPTYPCKGTYGSASVLCGPNAEQASANPGACHLFVGAGTCTETPTFKCTDTTDYYCHDDDQCLTTDDNSESVCSTSNYSTYT
ncbi:MAG: hypothetical protein ACK5Q5_19245, partial [Planctomycetaceae bacterium]